MLNSRKILVRLPWEVGDPGTLYRDAFWGLVSSAAATEAGRCSDLLENIFYSILQGDHFFQKLCFFRYCHTGYMAMGQTHGIGILSPGKNGGCFQLWIGELSLDETRLTASKLRHSSWSQKWVAAYCTFKTASTIVQETVTPFSDNEMGQWELEDKVALRSQLDNSKSRDLRELALAQNCCPAYWVSRNG